MLAAIVLAAQIAASAGSVACDPRGCDNGFSLNPPAWGWGWQGQSVTLDCRAPNCGNLGTQIVPNVPVPIPMDGGSGSGFQATISPSLHCEPGWSLIPVGNAFWCAKELRPPSP